MSDLSKEQIQEIKNWVSEGAQMADVQKRLKEDFDFNATYMDTRFLALDLELDFIRDEVVEEVVEPEAVDAGPVGVMKDEAPASSAPAPAAEVEVLAPAAGAPSVTVGLDQVAIPGSMVSGTVTFSDGEKGNWMIDEQGRPSIDPETLDYRPSQEDLADFQAKLQHIFETQM
ncbi:hypothetical protein V2O64_02120 [Verrucomicrobiaceae bacterium 227]